MFEDGTDVSVVHFALENEGQFERIEVVEWRCRLDVHEELVDCLSLAAHTLQHVRVSKR